MKSFSELLDTKQCSVLRLNLVPLIDNGIPHVKIVVNDKTYYDSPQRAGFGVVTALRLTEPLTVTITMEGKEYDSDKETAVVIEQFDIDGIDITPAYSHYAVYQNDHNDPAPTSYLGYNGTWTFETKVPFYNWLHQASGQGWLLLPK